MSTVAIERSIILLKHMATSANGVSVRDAARRLGYSPASVQKCLQALVAHDFATQDPVTQLYYLGPGALQVGLAALTKMEIRQVAHPYLEKLSESSGETALLGIPWNDEAIYVDKVVSPAEVRIDPPIGARRPFNCTAVGKIVLAMLREKDIDSLAAAGRFIQATPHSITDPVQLRAQTAEIRARGWALDCEEFIVGAMCVAAPIRNHDGVVTAVVALSGPAQRFKEREREFIDQVTACARDISAALGHQG